jgi:hypothetical protein
MSDRNRESLPLQEAVNRLRQSTVIRWHQEEADGQTPAIENNSTEGHLNSQHPGITDDLTTPVKSRSTDNL